MRARIHISEAGVQVAGKRALLVESRASPPGNDAAGGTSGMRETPVAPSYDYDVVAVLICFC
ncbi:MAG: hypothetical protein WBE45_14925 [Terriglobales bacterium]